MARAFHHFGGARFDLMMASDVLGPRVAVLARQFPNVYASGYWWHNFFPMTIEKIVGLRVQVAPMTKVGGFLCDAYYAEWSYGKLQVVRQGDGRRLRQAGRVSVLRGRRDPPSAPPDPPRHPARPLRPGRALMPGRFAWLAVGVGPASVGPKPQRILARLMGIY